MVVIYADIGEDRGESSLACHSNYHLTEKLQFKNLFDQLRLTEKEQKIAIEVLVSIAFEAGIECLIEEVTDDGALLQESSEIIFSDEDMEVGYPDHRRPFYLVASINQIPIKRALVDTGASVNLILLSTLDRKSTRLNSSHSS